MNQCWNIFNWTLKNKLKWNSNQNTKLSLHDNAFENVVCEMAAILSSGRWVKHCFRKVRRSTAHHILCYWQVSLLTELYDTLWCDFIVITIFNHENHYYKDTSCSQSLVPWDWYITAINCYVLPEFTVCGCFLSNSNFCGFILSLTQCLFQPHLEVIFAVYPLGDMLGLFT